MRDEVIRLRVTTAAKASWTKAARAAGMDLSSFAREAMRRAARGQTFEIERDRVTALADIRRQLAAIGNNLNQIARHANGGDAVADLTPMRQALADVAAAVEVRQ